MYIVATLTFNIRRGKSVKRRWGSHPLIMIVPCIQIVRWKCMFTAPKLRDIPSMPCYPQKSAGFTSEYLVGWFCGPLLSVHKSKKWWRSTFSDMPGYVLKTESDNFEHLLQIYLKKSNYVIFASSIHILL